MRYLLILVIFLTAISYCMGQKEDTTKVTFEEIYEGIQKAKKNPNRPITIDDLDESLENVDIVLENGIVKDTIYHDSLFQKMLLVKTLDIHLDRYLVFSKYNMEIPPKYDLSFYYVGHFITKADTTLFNDYNGQIINFDSLILPNPLVELRKCAHDSRIELWASRINNTEVDCNYIYVTLPLYDHTSEHNLIRDCNDELITIYKKESDRVQLFFSLKGDSVIVKH